MSKIFKAAGLLVVFLGILLISTGITVRAEGGDVIWIGDSRSVGLAKSALGLSPTDGTGGEAETVAHKDGYHFIAKCSQGYYWGKDAMNKIDEFDGNTIVIWLGVNDLGNKEKYRTWLTDLTGTYTVYLVSVTQCYSPSSISDERVSDFNDMLKSIEGATYIDAYSLFEISEPTVDSMGLHYGGSDYRRVFDLVKAEITGTPVTDSVLTAENRVSLTDKKPVYKTRVVYSDLKKRALVGGNVNLIHYVR